MRDLNMKLPTHKYPLKLNIYQYFIKLLTNRVVAVAFIVQLFASLVSTGTTKNSWFGSSCLL